MVLAPEIKTSKCKINPFSQALCAASGCDNERQTVYKTPGNMDPFFLVGGFRADEGRGGGLRGGTALAKGTTSVRRWAGNYVKKRCMCHSYGCRRDYKKVNFSSQNQNFRGQVESHMNSGQKRNKNTISRKCGLLRKKTTLRYVMEKRKQVGICISVLLGILLHHPSPMARVLTLITRRLLQTKKNKLFAYSPTGRLRQ